MQTFGLQITAFVIDDKTAALCCPVPLSSQDTLGRLVFINLSEHAQQRYQVHYFQKGSSCDEIQIMRILHAAGYEKAVILKNFGISVMLLRFISLSLTATWTHQM